jgi:magnesium transporter
MTDHTLTSKRITWQHIASASEKDLGRLQEDFRFHHLDYEDIRSETPISKMDAYKHYMFFIFHIPYVNKKTKQVRGRELYVFLSKDTLLTVSHASHDGVERLFERMRSNAKFRSAICAKGTSYLMYRILMEAFKKATDIVKHLAVEVERLEEEIENKRAKRLTVELGHTRRNALFLRRLIDPQRNILTSLSTMNRSFISEEGHLYFDDLQDLLDTVSLTADNLKAIVDGLFDVNEALLSHKTNEVVTLLTVLSAVLMVPTLLTGFYGMNVPWLPGAEDARFVSLLFTVGVVMIIVVMVAIVNRPQR